MQGLITQSVVFFTCVVLILVSVSLYIAFDPTPIEDDDF